ncbi:MAG TPA: LPS export ABC transporter permease LptG [Thermoanaerobaculia bacterium]|nr:LPS export ABC transporter permease LptG [Thermoanaerobaculia bacterium]
MKILSRYIFKEMIAPTLLGFSFYTFIILMRSLFDFAGMIIKRSLPGAVVGKLLLLSLPHIVVLTVPMSLLFGILIAIGRLSADSEIIAMRALGISTRTIYRPVFLFSFLTFLLNFYLMNVLLPRGNTQLAALRAEVFTSSIEKEIKPRVFYAEYENLVIYVNDIDPSTGLWKGVFVADSRSADDMKPAPATVQQQVEAAAAAEQALPFSQGRSSTKVIVAESGTLSIVGPSKEVWMNLNNAETHVWDPKRPDRYDRTINATQRMKLPDKFSGSQGVYIRSMRELNLRELIDQAKVSAQFVKRGPVFEEAYRTAMVEIHKKFAIPFACLVFGILGLPLGITNRRGGKSSGFSLSIAIILFYYVLINNGEAMAQSGKVSPAVGMWTPNVLLLVLGIWLLARANRETGFKSDRTPLWRRIPDALRRRRESAAPAPVVSAAQIAVDEEPVILNRLDITFPNILDRYILREFTKVLALVLISTITLFIIVDYTQLARDIRANQIAFHTVLAYYRFNIFQILHWTLPITVLVSTLVTFGIMSKNNEVTALKSGGVSLYRVALPVVFIASIIAILAYLMLDFVLPYANQRVDQLHNKIVGKGPIAMQAATQQQKLWFLGKNGRYIINFLSYDNNAKQLSQVQVLEFHPKEFRLTRRVYAERATWDGKGWVFQGGWMRSFSDDGRTVYSPIAAPLRLYYAERPDDFATEVKSPEQMTFAQLRRYIETIRRSGYSAEELTVKLYQKTSWPFISVVMALIALPFAFRMGRRGALYGFFIALLLGIGYWGVYSIFTKFGEVGNLPALLSAWSANIVFAIAAIYLFLNVET